MPDAAIAREAIVPSQTVVEMGCGAMLIVPGTATVKLPAVIVLHPIVISIGPVAAPIGTVTVRLVAVEAVMVADTPLNSTVFGKGVLKFVPVMVTDDPTRPDKGENDVIVGEVIDPIRF